MSPLTRSDLLELTADALIALANAGFVKRAQKDIAEGNLPGIEQHDDGTVTARYADGQVTTLPPGKTLRDAQCTCPASGLCRHRVTLVLAYQAHAQAAAPSADADSTTPGTEAPWCPSELADAISTLPAAVQAQAVKLAAARPIIKLTAWQAQSTTPMARLPLCNVRFFSRSSLAHARCDCQQGSGCAHVVVAIWAFQQAHAQRADFVEATVELQPVHTDGEEMSISPLQVADAIQAIDTIRQLANQLWLEGTMQPALAVTSRFEQAQRACTALGWCWVSESLSQLQQSIQDLHARSSRVDGDLILNQLSQLLARLAAAQHADQLTWQGQLPPIPASQILGIGIKGQVALDHLRLVSLGALCWADNQHEGAQLVFVDPDTLAITVLARSWPKMDDQQSNTTLADRRVVGQPLHRLATSQIVTKSAKRHANGLLEIASNTRQTNVLPLSSSSWDNLPAPLRQPSLAALRNYLQHQPPGFTRPLQVIEHVHVLPVANVMDWGWDAANQILQANLQIAEVGDEDEPSNDESLLLCLRHNPASPHAVDRLAHVLAGENGVIHAVAGMVQTVDGRLVMTPLAIMTDRQAHVLAFGPLGHKPTQALPSYAPDRATSDLQTMLGNTCALLSQWLRQGLRHQGQTALTRARDQAALLLQNGLTHCAQALTDTVDSLGNPSPADLANNLAVLHILLGELSEIE
ncbi:SWIM zinc finger family protein [Chitinivorax sp. B]|uniref:SWIM zinc finger family protein n=1 Tax=Chitinivorax sp. B TaxID=2502235 RepID=UPI0010F9C3D1|nr:SWIM zinc finger family protein [Chitinivorax sp. B]